VHAVQNGGEPASVILEDLNVDFDVCGTTLDIEIHINKAFAEQTIGHASAHADVTEVCLCAARVEIDIARNARQPPHILVLQERRVIPAQHNKCQFVDSAAALPGRCQMRREVELAGQLRVLGEADFSTIDIDIHTRCHGANVQNAVVSSGIKGGWELKHRAVNPHGVVLGAF